MSPPLPDRWTGTRPIPCLNPSHLRERGIRRVFRAGLAVSALFTSLPDGGVPVHDILTSCRGAVDLNIQLRMALLRTLIRWVSDVLQHVGLVSVGHNQAKAGSGSVRAIGPCALHFTF